MYNPDRLTSFESVQKPMGFDAADTLNGMPQLDNLPKDVLLLLEKGQVDAALALLAQMQNPGDGSMTFMAKMGENLMWAITLPMQIVMKLMQASKKNSRISEVNKLHASTHDQHQNALRFFKALTVKPLQKLFSAINHRISKIALKAFHGAQVVSKGIMNAYQGTLFLTQILARQAHHLKEKLYRAVDKVKELAQHTRERFIEPVKKAIEEQMHKLYEQGEKLVNKATELSQNSIQMVVHVTTPMVLPLYTLSLSLLKGTEYSVKQVYKQMKRAFNWVKKRAHGVIVVVNQVIVDCAQFAIRSFWKWIYAFLKRVFKLIAKLWIFTLDFIHITLELVKFVGRLSGLFFKTYLSVRILKLFVKK